MYFEDSPLGNGIKELYAVGYDYSQPALDKLLKKQKQVVIASLTTEQVGAINFLLDNGFYKVGRVKTNPNSGNKIALFVWEPPKKEKKKTKKGKR